MPGHITHSLFANAVLAPCHDRQIELCEHSGLFRLGAQGPDIFFYYLQGVLSRTTRGFGTRMHKSGYGKFVIRLCELAWQSKHRDILFAYAAGLATHYFLDTATHPYVYAKTEIFGSVIKNSAAHRNFETNIDTLLHTQLAKFLPQAHGRFWEYIFCPVHERRIAAEAAAEAAAYVYGKSPGSAVFAKAMGQMIWFTRVLQSRHGRRKRAIGLVEQMIGMRGMFSNMVHTPIPCNDKTDYLNISNTPWAAPWQPDDVQTSSFLDMFASGRDAAFDALNTMYNVVYNSANAQDLESLLPERALAKVEGGR